MTNSHTCHPIFTDDVRFEVCVIEYLEMRPYCITAKLMRHFYYEQNTPLPTYNLSSVLSRFVGHPCHIWGTHRYRAIDWVCLWFNRIGNSTSTAQTRRRIIVVTSCLHSMGTESKALDTRKNQYIWARKANAINGIYSEITRACAL